MNVVADQPVAVPVGIHPGPIIDKGPQMISTAITPLENGGMDPLQMAANKIDAVIIFHLAIITNEAVLAFYERLGYADDQTLSLGKRLIPDL